MAENKKTFIFYRDWKSAFDYLDELGSGKLIKHMLSYVNDENPSDPSGEIGMAWALIKPRLKEDLKKWEARKQARSEAGRKGGLAKASNAKQTLANLPVNVNVNVSKDIYIPSKEDLWKFLREKKRTDAFKQLWNKIESWKLNGWKDLKGNKIQRWKAKINSQLAYIPEPKKDPNLPI